MDSSTLIVLTIMFAGIFTALQTYQLLLDDLTTLGKIYRQVGIFLNVFIIYLLITITNWHAEDNKFYREYTKQFDIMINILIDKKTKYGYCTNEFQMKDLTNIPSYMVESEKFYGKLKEFNNYIFECRQKDMKLKFESVNVIEKYWNKEEIQYFDNLKEEAFKGMKEHTEQVKKRNLLF